MVKDSSSVASRRSPHVVKDGYSTAASVHQALAISVAMAIDSGNLMPAARSLRSRYPNSPMLIAGDHNIGLTFRRPPLGNVGLERAERAAREIGARVSVPSGYLGLDWNDVLVKYGKAETAAAMRRNGVTRYVPRHAEACKRCR
jgi:phage/plasmid primase-like uncharacterized protein